MCGFVGGVFVDALKGEYEEAFRNAVRCLAHRGPDAEGLLCVPEAQAILAFRRLSIIDLATGHQPMEVGGRHFLTFNGEIYNYQDVRRQLEGEGVRFGTSSDTEVLLQSLIRKGLSGLEELRGMFAFAYLDAERQHLLLARDRLGIKQLYYSEHPLGLFFASEPKALLALPWIQARLDARQLPSYFTFRCVPSPDTLYEGIKKLPAGMALERDAHGVCRSRRYWSFPRVSDRPLLKASDALDVFEAAFLKAVERRLVADVPVGAFLSGGLDSSLVVAAIRRLGHRDFHTFTATFPGSRDDESKFAQRVSDRFDSVNHPVALDPDRFLSVLPRWIDLNDDLVADASSLPMLLVSDVAREEGRVVMLSGEGADELFGGYGSYHKFLTLRGIGALIPSTSARMALVSLATRIGMIHGQDLPRVCEYFVRRKGYLGTAALLGATELEELLPSAANHHFPRASGASFTDLTEFDFERRIPDDVLVRTDRATMGASIEARVPFLDHDLVELCVRIPQRLRSVPGISKVMLRRLAVRWGIPNQTLYHRKIGFQLPTGPWFRGPLRPIWRSVLERRAIPGLDYNVVKRVVDAHATGQGQYEELLWRILALETWYARWIGRGSLETLMPPVLTRSGL
jgi:asparagine synthase (glutamine-hydrolysing)